MLVIKYCVVILFFIFVVDCVIDDYRFVSEVNGYLKLHRVPAKWQNARLRCHLEGGVLVSPTNANELSAMTAIMSKANLSPSRVYTGIHATYSSGDFTTLAGVPLSQIDVNWDKDEPNNLDNSQNCLIMLESGEVSDVDCESDHPYICYKSIEKIDVHKCGPQYIHSDYTFDNRSGSCYKFHKEGRSWPMAFETCMAEDGYLAIINSNLESEVISKIFNEHPANTIPGDFHKDATSIGFSMWKEYGEWFTIHGTSLAEAGFCTFNKGEPNNIGGNEWCGSVWRNGFLNDHHCPRILTFICEKSPSQDYENGENQGQF